MLHIPKYASLLSKRAINNNEMNKLRVVREVKQRKRRWQLSCAALSLLITDRLA